MIYAGFGIRFHDIKFTYVQNYHSRRFKEQQCGKEFVSITISYRF